MGLRGQGGPGDYGRVQGYPESDSSRTRVIVAISAIVVIAAVAAFIVVFASRACDAGIAANSGQKSWSTVESGKRFLCNKDTVILPIDAQDNRVDSYDVEIVQVGKSKALASFHVQGTNGFTISDFVSDGLDMPEEWYTFRLTASEGGTSLCELSVNYRRDPSAPEGVRVRCG